MTFSLESVLDTVASAIEKPPLLPEGHYTWVIKKPHTHQTRGSDGQFEVLEWQVEVVAAQEDVDEADLEAFGDPAGTGSRFSFFFNKEEPTKAEGTLFRMTRFLVDILEAGDESMPLTELLANAVNCQFVAKNSWKASKEDSRIFYANIDGNPAKAD